MGLTLLNARSSPSLLCRPRALAYRGSFSSTLLLLEDINLVPILHPAGLVDVLLAEAVTVECEADSLLAEAELLAVGVHQLSEGGGLLDPELNRGAATLVRHKQVNVLVVSYGSVHLGLGVYSFGFGVLHGSYLFFGLNAVSGRNKIGNSDVGSR